MDRLSTLDSTFLRLESPQTPMHVGGLLIFKIPEGAAKDYLQNLFNRIRTAPVATYPFYCKLKNARIPGLAPSWTKDENIDIDYHVRHSALPYPGGERELGVLVARLHSHPLDMTRPLWEFHLIEGLENNRFALYLKAHHAAIDGVGAMKLVKQWLSPAPDQVSAAAPWSVEREQNKPPSPVESVAENWRQSAVLVSKQLKSAKELVLTLYKLSDKNAQPEGGMHSALQTPASLFNLPVTQQRRLATQLFDFDRFKKISKETNTTVNDVALAVVGAAARRYLQELDALPEHPLVASVPIGLPRPDGKPGNAVAGFVCPLATHYENCADRLQNISLITKRTKEQLLGLSMSALDQLSILGFAPLLLGQLTGLGTKMKPFFNFIVSNVIASREKLYLADAELEAIYPISILFDGYALNITVVGYADKIGFGFTGCRDAMPSLQKLAVYTGEALTELEQTIFNQ